MSNVNEEHNLCDPFIIQFVFKAHSAPSAAPNSIWMKIKIINPLSLDMNWMRGRRLTLFYNSQQDKNWSRFDEWDGGGALHHHHSHIKKSQHHTQWVIIITNHDVRVKTSVLYIFFQFTAHTIAYNFNELVHFDRWWRCMGRNAARFTVAAARL